jgi:hypothetical protein
MPGDDVPQIFVSSSLLRRRLGVTDVQVSYLADTGLFDRVPYPSKPRMNDPEANDERDDLGGAGDRLGEASNGTQNHV